MGRSRVRKESFGGVADGAGGVRYGGENNKSVNRIMLNTPMSYYCDHIRRLSRPCRARTTTAEGHKPGRTGQGQAVCHRRHDWVLPEKVKTYEIYHLSTRRTVGLLDS